MATCSSRYRSICALACRRTFCCMVSGQAVRVFAAMPTGVHVHRDDTQTRLRMKELVADLLGNGMALPRGERLIDGHVELSPKLMTQPADAHVVHTLDTRHGCRSVFNGV